MSTSGDGSDASVTESTLKHNTAAGHIAGRDVNVSTVNLPAPASKANDFICLVERYRKEKTDNKEFRETIDRLQYYSSYAPDEKRRSLLEKMQAGKCDHLYQFALRTKEIFTKKLAQNQLYESAQEIHAYLLAEVYTRYCQHVYHHVRNGASQDVVNQLVQTQVIDPVKAILADNVLSHHSDDIYGMLYFLTGHCHINWD